MQNISDKLRDAKNALTGQGTTQTGTVGSAYNETEYAPATQATAGASTGGTTMTTETAGQEAVCGRETFAKVEDRPVIIERKERYMEHMPVEREFVTETKFVGERELVDQRTVEVLGTEEKVVAVAEPKAPCDL